jgi:Glucose-6-phosphate dehydrogenase, NAD binding domain
VAAFKGERLSNHTFPPDLVRLRTDRESNGAYFPQLLEKEEAMSDFHSDALVFFGATGDLAYKKIFPALQSLVKRGRLNTPVIGVARSGWNIDQLRARARDSLEKHGGGDPAAFERLSDLLRYDDSGSRRRDGRPGCGNVDVASSASR